VRRLVDISASPCSHGVQHKGKGTHVKRLLIPALATSVALLLNGCGATAATTAAPGPPVQSTAITTASVPATTATTAPTAQETAVARTSADSAALVTTSASQTSAAAAVGIAATAQATSARALPAVTSTAPAPAGGGTGGFEGDYQKMQQAMFDARSWRQVMVTTGGSGTQAQVTFEFVRPDRLHEKVTSTGGKTIEEIVIGADVYTNTGTTWQKVAGGASGQAFLAGIAGAKPGTPEYDQMQQSLKDRGFSIAKGSQSTRNGVPCQEWGTTSSTPPTSGVICIGLRDNLPVESKSSSGDGSTVTVTYSDWNTPITINAPI
jgi:hypothetical protein